MTSSANTVNRPPGALALCFLHPYDSTQKRMSSATAVADEVQDIFCHKFRIGYIGSAPLGHTCVQVPQPQHCSFNCSIFICYPLEALASVTVFSMISSLTLPVRYSQASFPADASECRLCADTPTGRHSTGRHPLSSPAPAEHSFHSYQTNP